MEKLLNVNESRIIKMDTDESNFECTTSFNEFFLRNGIIEKNYSFHQYYDYNFNVFLSNKIDDDHITFEYDIDHPLYFAFLHLLSGDDSLLIEDDDTREYNKKYLVITKNDDKILLTFVNKKDEKIMWEKFNVFIKNTMYDLRSKIDVQELDTKNRLSNFFNEVRDELSHDYHQISIEEYVLKKELKNKK